ncbi:MAG: CRISPR-associated protein Cmr3 [Chloroflexi bacterium]|nr:CRISPR-associated protein Cmr3 [Chloroflexota bacterium]
MELWMIEPHDPLIVRDGRPFGPTPGARAKTLAFPFPATIAGGVRTRAGTDENGLFDTSDANIDAVKNVGIRGPLLAEVDDKDEAALLVAAPADALLLQDADTKQVARHSLRPLALPGGALSDLPQPLDYPVGLAEPDLRKPYKDAPRYWRWTQFEAWLTNKPDKVDLSSDELAQLGHNGPTADWRVHVAIDPKTQTGIDGSLFATSGLTFSHKPRSQTDEAATTLHDVKRLALVTAVEYLNGLDIAEQPAPLGGERRIMHWRKSSVAWEGAPPAIIADEIAQTGYCRLVLLTPAYFTAGWQPDWLLQSQHGVQPELKAAVLGKPQTISGWDFEKGQPKETRRLVPAGSVYFLHLKGEDKDIRQWIDAIWLQNISDKKENRLAGFGLAALGIWPGKPETINVKEVSDA